MPAFSLFTSMALSALCVLKPGPFDVLYLAVSWFFSGAAVREWLDR